MHGKRNARDRITFRTFLEHSELFDANRNLMSTSELDMMQSSDLAEKHYL